MMFPTPQSPRSTQGTTSSHSRPSRLRSACTQCSIAKVKCSGERAGCDRCRSTGSACVYIESRVGRVQGPRARGRPPPNGEHNHRRHNHQHHYHEISQQQQRRQTSAPGRASFSTEGSVVGGSPLPSSGGSNNDAPNELIRDEGDGDDAAEDDIMAWTTNSWHIAPPSESSTRVSAAVDGTDNAHDPSSIHVAPSGVDAGRIPASGSAGTTMVSVSGCDDYDLAELDTDLAEFLMVQSPESHNAANSVAERGAGGPGGGATFAKAQQMIPISLGLQPRNEVDSQCCIECCQVINDLESYIMAELRTFKILLSIIRKALEKLGHLIRIQQGSRNRRCMMLFTALLYQIYELLETCFTTVVQEKDRQLGQRGVTGVLPSSIGFGFGDLSAIDAEEQAVLRTQSVLREVQQASEVLEKLKALSTVDPGADGALGAQGPDPARVSEAHGNCYLDLESRLRDLSLRFSTARQK